jgi:uncharacterized protein DUF3309
MRLQEILPNLLVDDPDLARDLNLSRRPLTGARAGGVKKALSRIAPSSYSRLMRNILLIILILLLIGAFPGWGYSSGWGYYPFGGLGLVLLVVLILAVSGKL